MKAITMYQCEICHQQYDTEQQALKCESKGLFNPAEYPKGLMFEYNHHGYVGIFAIPEDIKATTGGFNKGHIGESHFWACRVGGNDTLASKTCGHTYFRSGEIADWAKYNYISDENIGCKEYNRMVTFLKSLNIQPSYYNQSGEFITVK